jgi:hypothetical protein
MLIAFNKTDVCPCTIAQEVCMYVCMYVCISVCTTTTYMYVQYR